MILVGIAILTPPHVFNLGSQYSGRSIDFSGPGLIFGWMLLAGGSASILLAIFRKKETLICPRCGDVVVKWGYINTSIKEKPYRCRKCGATTEELKNYFIRHPPPKEPEVQIETRACKEPISSHNEGKIQIENPVECIKKSEDDSVFGSQEERNKVSMGCAQGILIFVVILGMIFGIVFVLAKLKL